MKKNEFRNIHERVGPLGGAYALISLLSRVAIYQTAISPLIPRWQFSPPSKGEEFANNWHYFFNRLIVYDAVIVIDMLLLLDS